MATVFLDLQDECSDWIDGPQYARVEARILTTVKHDGATLYAVVATVDGAPWYGLIHENSTALLGGIGLEG